MKPTAQFLGLVFAALSATALGVDKPVPADAEPTPAEARKAETAAVTPPALSAPVASPLDSARGLSLSNGQANPPSGPGTPAAPFSFSPLAHPTAEEKPTDPDVLELPKMVVKQKPRPRLTPEIMVTKKAFGEDLAKQKYSALDQALNKFTLPLFGTSLAERALEDHQREKKQELNLDVLNMVKALDTVDPAEAKSLKEAAARP